MHGSFERMLKAVHNLRQHLASVTEGPPTPDVRIAVARMQWASIASYTTRCST